MDARKGIIILLSIIVMLIWAPGASAHRPEEGDSSTIINLPDIETSYAYYIVAQDVDNGEFYEPFTQTNYWSRQTIELDLPQTGTYFLLVWQPEGETGKYVLDTGTEEVFGPADLFNFPAWWLNVHAYFGHLPYIVSGTATFLLLIVAAVFIFRHNWATEPSLEQAG